MDKIITQTTSMLETGDSKQIVETYEMGVSLLKKFI